MSTGLKLKNADKEFYALGLHCLCCSYYSLSNKNNDEKEEG